MTAVFMIPVPHTQLWADHLPVTAGIYFHHLCTSDIILRQNSFPTESFQRCEAMLVVLFQRPAAKILTVNAEQHPSQSAKHKLSCGIKQMSQFKDQSIHLGYDTERQAHAKFGKQSAESKQTGRVEARGKAR